jgi:hypothetical protein
MVKPLRRGFQPIINANSLTWAARALSRGIHREEREYADDYNKRFRGVNSF